MNQDKTIPLPEVEGDRSVSAHVWTVIFQDVPEEDGRVRSHVVFPVESDASGQSLGASVYPGDDHWFYVTYGLSDGWVSAADGPDSAAFGFELTMRVPRGEENTAPTWPFDVLWSLAQHAHGAVQERWIGDRIDVGGIVRGEGPRPVRTVAITSDVVLAPIEIPEGRVEYWQVVGLTDLEAARARSTSTGEVLAERVESGDRFLITSPPVAEDVPAAT